MLIESCAIPWEFGLIGCYLLQEMGILEIKHGLLHIAETLDFLHNNARLIHRAISPEVGISFLHYNINTSIYSVSCWILILVLANFLLICKISF